VSSKRRRLLICTSVLLAPLALTLDTVADSGDPNSAAALTVAADAPQIILAQAQAPDMQDTSAEDSNAPQAAEPRPVPATASAAPREPGTPAAPPAQSGPDTDTGTDAEKAAESPPDSRASPQRFVPSEQVRADFDVSFPIDI